jgi:hypothetical protein
MASRDEQIAFLRRLGLLGEEPTDAEEDSPPDFDGGVRETPPLPSDPVAEHNATILEYLRTTQGRGGGWDRDD